MRVMHHFLHTAIFNVCIILLIILYLHCFHSIFQQFVKFKTVIAFYAGPTTLFHIKNFTIFFLFCQFKVVQIFKNIISYCAITI